MVGPAFTQRYIPAREDLNQLTEFRKPDHPQRVAIETCPAGSVLVFDSCKVLRLQALEIFSSLDFNKEVWPEWLLMGGFVMQ